MMKSEKTPDFRGKCVKLKAQVEHLLKQEKLLTEKNNEMAQRLSSMQLVKKMTVDNGRYMLVEEEEKPNELAIKCQVQLRSAKRKIENLEKEILTKQKSFEQAFCHQKKEQGRIESNCIRAEASREHRETDVEILKGEQRRLEDRIKHLKKEVKDLNDDKIIAMAEEERRNEQVRHREKMREWEVIKERKSARQFKEKMEKLIIEKNRLTIDHEKQKQDDEIQKKVMCDLKKERNALRNKLKNINTEHSKVDQQKEGLISDLEEVIVDVRNNRENQETYQQNIINTLNKKILHDSEIKTKLEQKESELMDINNSNNQEIINLKNLITELKKNNKEAVAERDLYHQNWQKAVTKVDLQDRMIVELQTKTKQRAGETNVLIDDLVVVKEHHRLVSNRLKNVKRQLSESRKALDVCLTSADNERELGEKKMAEMVSEKEELEKELQQHKALLEEYKAQEDKLKASHEILLAENTKYKKEQEESEQVREKYREVVLNRLQSPLPPIPNFSQNVQSNTSRHARFPLLPHRKLTQLPPISKDVSRSLSAPSPSPISPLPNEFQCSGTKISPRPPALASKNTRKKSNQTKK